MNTSIRRRSHLQPQQRGMALVISLIFLLMLTLLGVASMSTNTAEERMTYAAADYTRAFQSADSAISQAEDWLMLLPATNMGTGCSSACLVFPNTATVSNASLRSAGWWTTNGLSFADTYTTGTTGTNRSNTQISLGRLTTDPEYVVQYIKGDISCSISAPPNQPKAPCPQYYRVTGLGQGVETQMQALTQTTYAPVLPPPP